MDWSVNLFNWGQIWEAAGPFIISIVVLLASVIIVFPLLSVIFKRSARHLVVPAGFICIAASVIAFIESSEIWASK
ncbi:hypothetical protein [Paenibacillus algicola]|uniref:hypothetical protein n=1 Tax=Paenibacillus algicola TaxID=2565926 RepID=UPI001C304B7F|nr:hypothetical protein [Paenibacillus algicola]